MFERGLERARELGPRGTALTMFGVVSFLAAHPEVAPAADTATGFRVTMALRPASLTMSTPPAAFAFALSTRPTQLTV